MDKTSARGTPMRAARRRSIAVGSLLIVAAVGLGAVAWIGKGTRGHGAEEVSVYKNARPGVKYVGDAACVKCHKEIAGAYKHHPMGESLVPIVEAEERVRGEDQAKDLFDAGKFRYSAERRDGKTFHKETTRDSRGRVMAELEGEVKYVLGSGSRAMSFLIDREGFLFESPITWYGQTKKWALSPGFEDKANNRFERPITPGCLFCHANQVEHVADTLNRYQPPIFRGHAIGCERCHGPGELHARDPQPDSEDGPNIVNPTDLVPTLREAVCEQCHLSGEESVETRGRSLFDFRPGLPLSRFETVFVRPPGTARENLNAGHVEQMHASRCYRESQGAMGCISCHDPHALPAPEEKLTYYRDRCMACHDEKACSLPIETRRARSKGDDCVACHMPRADTADIPHVATTVHHIPRRIDGVKATAKLDETRLVPFDDGPKSAEDRPGRGRDLGIILSTKGSKAAAEALGLLDEALAAHPDDVTAREARGHALKALGRGEEAMAAFESALGLAPDRETALVAAASLADDLGRRDASLAYWRRAIVVDPWRADYYAGEARQLSLARRWAEATEACRMALQLNPANLPARIVLVRCTLRMGSPALARQEFDALLEFDPPDRAGLTRWFQSLR